MSHRFRLSAVDLPDPHSADPFPAVEAALPEAIATGFTIPPHWVDLEGKPIKYYPVRFSGPPQRWYDQLHTMIKPAHCGWPDGRTLTHDGLKICRKLKAEGRARCRRHAPHERGVAAIAVGHVGGREGQWSHYLPDGYWQIYERVRKDPNLLHIRQDAELIAIRQVELVEQLHSGESGSLWRALKEAWAAVRAASRDGNAELLRAALQDVGKVIDDGSKREKLWKEIINVTGQVVTLKRAEHQRLKELHEMLTVERFLTMLAAYHEIVLAVTPEKERRAKIARKLQAIIEGGMGGGTPAEDGEGEVVEEGGEGDGGEGEEDAIRP